MSHIKQDVAILTFPMITTVLKTLPHKVVEQDCRQDLWRLLQRTNFDEEDG